MQQLVLLVVPAILLLAMRESYKSMKSTISKNIAIASVTLIGAIVQQSTAQALTFSFDSVSSGSGSFVIV